MKKVILSLLMMGATVMAFGQTTKIVKGVVIDKNGNPLPGATIEATGGSESTESATDGTFSIEVSRWLVSLTCSYPGIGKKTVKLDKENKELVIKMKGERSMAAFASALGFADTDASVSKKEKKSKKKKNSVSEGQVTIVVKGAVIDKNGNAVPGATVETTGGAESTMTGSDGTFSIEVSRWLKTLTVTCPGMHKKEVKIDADKDELIIKMSGSINKMK